MTKTELLRPYAATPELQLLLARLLDKHALTQQRDVPAFTVFLTPEERAVAEELLQKLPPLDTVFFGGYSEAERQICAFLPSWMTEELLFAEYCPICAVEVRVPAQADLTHRDYLGSLMGLGISREKFGDILRLETGCQLILLQEVLPILESQWEKVGRYPITLTPIALSELKVTPPTVRKIRDTVASLRLDGVIAAGFSISRSRASELIEAGRVQRNHRTCEKVTQTVAQGDVFSCRGMGKCMLQRAEGKSKKGRIIIELDRYE